MKTTLIGACLISFSLQTFAKDVWECGNAVLQDLCQNQKCTGGRPADMDKLTISIQGQKNVAICSDRSCWRGEGSISHQNAQSILKIHNIHWQDRDQPNAANNYVLAINRTTQALYFEGKNENHPVACRAV